MADNNRNRQDSWRSQSDWRDNQRRQQRIDEDEPNYTISENRGHRDTGNYEGMSSGEGGWQSRYERQMNTNREGDFDSGYNPRQYGRQGDDYNWGSAQRGLSSGYSDFGGDYGSMESRNLYDRGNQGLGRRDYQNRENRIGGANYDKYGDHGRYDQGRRGDNNKGYSNTSFGRPDYGRSDYGRSDWNRDSNDYRRRDYGHGDSEERSWWDRTSDEVSSWFGDEDAERRRTNDRQYRGMHKGKGPRNYSRSDDRIKDDINDRLSDDPFVDASDVDVTVNNGEVTLTGMVDHRSTKRRAEDLAEMVSGVKNVENRLRVTQYATAQTPGATGSSSTSGASGTSSTPVAGTERPRKETSYGNKS